MLRDQSWHDHDVACAADAWLHEPRDTQAYQRLVDAVLRRRAFLQPTLNTPEVLDELGALRPPQRLGELLAAALPTVAGEVKASPPA